MKASLIRKSIVALGLIGAIGFGSAGVAGAETTRHFTKNEVKAGCQKAGGIFGSAPNGNYGCWKDNANGSFDVLTCTKKGCDHTHYPARVSQSRSVRGGLTGTVLR